MAEQTKPKRGRGRPKGYIMPQRSKDRIRESINAKLCIDKLEAAIAGKNPDMQPHHVTAALGLLRKTIPDLTSAELVADIRTDRAEELSDAELADIVTGRSQGVVEAQEGQEEPDSVH